MRRAPAQTASPLDETTGLAKRLFAKPWLQPARRAQVYLSAEQLELLLERSTREQTHWVIELDAQVDVAVWACFVAGDRAEEQKRSHAASTEVGLVLGQDVAPRRASEQELSRR